MTEFLEKYAVTINKEKFSSAVKELETLVESAVSENELQAHIEKHPYILSQQFSHCHHVFPKVKLGIQYETDFMCLEIPSSGKEWIGVELEIPNKKVITKKGRKTSELEHAIQQIRDWRSWVTENLSYARQDKEKNGLGLSDIVPCFYGYVIIGRREEFTERFNEMRRQIQRDELITIRSWDGVIEWAYKRAEFFSYIVDSQEIINMQQELTKTESEYNDLNRILVKIEHLQDIKHILDDNIDLYDREYRREIMKIENEFPEIAKKLVTNLLGKGNTYDVIYQKVKDIIPTAISYDLFNDYLSEKSKN
ncbi:MAG: DUF4263 domain-containing protein [Desulfobulbus sp.]|nr:DUF4263 domain-containing protein [Desulfobulbus sp.]